MPAIGLTFRNVGEMDLYDGDADGTDAVGKGDGSVGIAAGVHHHGVVLSVGGLQLVDQNALVVGLAIMDFVLWETLAKLWQVVVEGETSVNFGFALAQKVQIGSVEDENFHRVLFLQK